MLKLIKKPDGLRVGNLILVDDITFPPNFILSQTSVIGEGFEAAFNENTLNCAYLNANDKWMEKLLPEKIDGKLCKGEFIAEKIYEPKLKSEFIKWRIKFREKEACISFIHELQNYYFDWTNTPLIEK